MIKAGPARLALIVIYITLLCGGGGRAAVPGIDPAPYDRVVDCVRWKSQDGRGLDFCILGYEGEERGRTLAVYEVGPRGARRIFLDQERGFNPWKIMVAELDGDTLPEIAVGAYKAARFDPTLDNRLLIFDWTLSDTLFAKWLGSRLGLPYLDFAFARGPDGIDRLLSIEHAGQERLVLRQYHWNGFGFSHDRDWRRISNPENFEISASKLKREMEELERKGVTP